MPGSELIYPISVVMSLTNLTARQIRYYEMQGLIKPARSKGNQRLYTPDDVAALALIKTLLEKGLNLDGIKAVLAGAPLAEIGPAPTGAAPATETSIYGQRPASPHLTSLYPVNNQEALTNWLQRKRK